MSRKVDIQAGPPPATPIPNDARKSLAQEAFDEAREALLECWGELVQVLGSTEVLQEAQATSWAMVQTAMLFQWNGEARQ